MAKFAFLTVVFAAATSLVNSQYNKTILACRALASNYPNDTEFPNTPDYSALNVYWANNTALTPHCIFTPRSSKAAARALRTLQHHNTVFAIRSGGHSINTGFSSSSGVVINLSRLNNITVDLAAGTAKIGPGNTWEVVYRTLAPYGVTVAGGRAWPVGVGGLSLGGGLSFYLYERGFSCDTIVEYEVVTAAGSILTVNAFSHKDLFVALKGSGAPFVLVTSFTYTLIPAGGIYGGGITARSPTVPRVLDAVVEFVGPGGGVEDYKSHLISVVGVQKIDVGGGFMAPVAFTLNTLFYRDPVSSTPAAFAGIVAATANETLSSTVRAPREIADLTLELAGAPGRQLWVPVTMANPSKEGLKGLYQIFEETILPLMDVVPGFAAAFVLIPMGKQGRGENVLGLKDNVRYLLVQYVLFWSEAADEGTVRAARRRLNRRNIEYLKSVGQLSPWIYMNYASDEQDPIASYGQKNVEKLRKVQRKYDPDRVWETLVKGGFKIPQRSWEM